MENDFVVHYQTWKNKLAVEKVLTDFRKYFPNTPIRLISDNGAQYDDYVHRFQIDYEFKSTNVFPGGKFGNIEQCYEWLYRVYETCKSYDTEWVVLFEDDVITTHSDIEFPTQDSGGFIIHSWNPQLETLLRDRNQNNKNWGYGMCGGPIFKREAFLTAYEKINEFNIDELSKLDERIKGWSDTLINCFLQYFGYTYQVWDSMEDMSYPNRKVSEKACFIHGYKELY